MFDDAYQSGTDTSLADLARKPVAQPVPQQRFSLWRSLTAVPRGVAAAENQVLGSTADVLQAFGAASALTLQGDPAAQAALGKERIEQGAKEARGLLDRGEAMTSPLGTELRGYAQYWAPDPVTAHWSEQLLFDFARAGAKVAGGAALAGPFGIGAAAVEEGITVSDSLREQGVDLGARTAVGAIQGAGLALGAVVPVFGRTATRTAALVAAGGPGAFIAQQAATRAILQASGHERLAESYDPFDPVGLAVSTLLPAAFGAYGMRAARRAGAMTPKGETNAGAPETEGASRGTVPADVLAPDSETVDAARVTLAAEHVRETSLADPHDLAGGAKDDAAMRSAHEQLAKGEPVNVTDLAPQGEFAAAKIDEFRTRLEAEMPPPEPTAAPEAVVPRIVDAEPLPNTAVAPSTPGETRIRVEESAPAPNTPTMQRDDFQPQQQTKPPRGEDQPSPFAARIAAMEQTHPGALDTEIPTAWNDKGEVTERRTARDLMAEIESQAAEELKDVDLMQVAATCFLSS